MDCFYFNGPLIHVLSLGHGAEYHLQKLNLDSNKKQDSSSLTSSVRGGLRDQIGTLHRDLFLVSFL